MIYLIGAGGHGKVVLEALLASRCQVRLLDADAAMEGKRLLGMIVEREERALAALAAPARFFAAIGDGKSRERVTERWEGLGHELVRAIHPRSSVSPWAILAPGVAVMAGAVVQPEARIEKGAIVNSGATVDHDCAIGPFAHIAPGAHLAGGVEVGRGAWVGIGSAVREGVVIGPRTVVGAGSVVVDDLPKDVVAFGNPCRPVRQIGRAEDRPPAEKEGGEK